MTSPWRPHSACSVRADGEIEVALLLRISSQGTLAKARDVVSQRDTGTLKGLFTHEREIYFRFFFFFTGERNTGNLNKITIFVSAKRN